MSKIKFINAVYSALRNHLKKNGKDDITADFYANTLTGQACYESAYGMKESGKYNYWGLKATKDQDATVSTTHEYSGANRKKIEDRFLNFESLEEAARVAVDRIDKKFHGFDGEQTISSYVDSIYKYKYFTTPPELYKETLSAILNGKLFVQAAEERKRAELRAQNRKRLVIMDRALALPTDAIKNYQPKIISGFGARKALNAPSKRQITIKRATPSANASDHQKTKKPIDLDQILLE